MKKKPITVLVHFSRQQQWKLWSFCLAFSLVVFNTSFLLMADTSNNTLPQDGFNMASFQAASNPTGSSNQHWTIGEEIAALISAIVIGGGTYKFYQYRNSRNNVGEQNDNVFDIKTDEQTQLTKCLSESALVTPDPEAEELEPKDYILVESPTGVTEVSSVTAGR